MMNDEKRQKTFVVIRVIRGLFLFFVLNFELLRVAILNLFRISDFVLRASDLFSLPAPNVGLT